MAHLVLAMPDIGLWSDFAATRLTIAHLQVAAPDIAWDETSVLFDGDTDPTPYAGEGRASGIEVTCRFTAAEHSALVALEALLTAARTAADRRLQIRPNGGLVPGFDQAHVGTVPMWSRPRVLGQVYDLTFRLRTANHTIEAS